ncbi:MAG: AAA family ATPase [Microbacteriaceae bacterium]|nr:AAA family ATPase [Microbacteriaceae bacterium]
MHVINATLRRFPHGLVIGKFYPLHAGHSFLIRHALRSCDTVTVQVFGSSVESISLEERTAWVREEFPTARVVSAMDDAPVDFDSDGAWRTHVRLIESLLTTPVDAVFTSDAYGQELARRLSAEWVPVDPQRMSVPVSGTAIRADLVGHWAELPASARASLTARVVVLGAESTGSTTLAEALAHELHTHWVPEYGREYSLIREGGPFAEWHTEEFDLVVDRQIAREWAARRTAPVPVIVCDTDVLATALWHERYLGAPAPQILATAKVHRPTFYVLTGDDIPFVQDGIRDGEHLRHEMAERFRTTLRAQSVPFIEVRGSVAERVAIALAALRPVLARHGTFADPLEMRSAAEQLAIHRTSSSKVTGVSDARQ